MANQRLIYGFHAVNARLWQNPKSITELYVQEGKNDARTRDVLEKAANENVRVHFADADRLNAISKGARHQGVVGFIDASKNHVHLEDVLENLSEPPLLLILDGITDPHNLGAIIRSAAAFGADAVVIPERRSAAMTAASWKSSAGTAARIPVARVKNLNRALGQMADAGFTVAGLAGEGDTDVAGVPGADGPLALVVGSEGQGLSRLAREHCDVLVAVPVTDLVESLNASVAAAIALYEVSRSRG